jgi:hypothetical protein
MAKSQLACRLCGRVTRKGTTKHHLIPRTCHSNKWFKRQFTREQMDETISVCHDCHSSIHKFIPKEKDLGRHYHTVETLLAHGQLGKFVAWVRKQR